jgi:hypothetical protein
LERSKQHSVQNITPCVQSTSVFEIATLQGVAACAIIVRIWQSRKHELKAVILGRPRRRARRHGGSFSA